MFKTTPCPECGKTIKFREEHVGKTARCPHCKAKVPLLADEAPMATLSPGPAADVPTAQAPSLDDLKIDVGGGSQPRPSSLESTVDFTPGVSLPSVHAAPSRTPAVASSAPAAKAASSAPAAKAASAARAPAVRSSSGTKGASPGTDVNMLSTGLIAVGMTAALFAVVWPLHHFVLHDPVTALLAARGWVPFAVMYLAAWSVAILFMKTRKIAQQKASLLIDVLPSDISADIRPRNAGEFRNQIASLRQDLRNTLFVNRVDRALEHFQSRGSVQEVSEVLRSRAEIDASGVESSYTMIKVFIWAIPILGFIGTVLGISVAVGGFSTVFEGSGELDQITKSLGGVTAGLALAFDTTLLALIVSMCIMFPVSSLQKSEEALLNSVDEYCIETLLPRLQDGKHEGPVNADEIRDAVADAMQGQDARFRVWRENLEAIGTSLNAQVAQGMGEVYRQLQADYQNRMGEVQQQAAAERTALVEQVQSIQREQITQLTTATDTMRALATEMQQEIVSLQQEEVDRIAQVRQQIDGTVQALRDVAAESQQQFGSMQQEHLDRTTEVQLQHAAQMGEVQQQLTAGVASLAEVLQGRNDLAELQQALATNLQLLASSENFTETLRGLEQTLSQLGPTVERLGQQAAAGNGGGWAFWRRR